MISLHDFRRRTSSMSVREDAARWFAIIHRGMMTLEERALYERWLNEEPHRRALTEMQQAWDMLEVSRRPQAAAAAHAHQPARRIMLACMCVVSLGILALSYVHTSFWTSLDWVTR
jgi:ferric-dicitrate binding protein FerR (iron transport regulator)